MKASATVALVSTLLLLAFSVPPTSAQLGSTFGDLYFNSAPDGSGDAFITAFAFAPFDFYVIVEIDFADDGRPGENFTNGFFGWETQVNLPPDPNLVILARSLNPPTSLNVASGFDNFIVGTGTNITAASTPYAVLQYTALFVTPTPAEDLVLTFGPSDPASFADPEPHWAEFGGAQQVHRFATWQNNRFVINCVNEPECGADPTIELTVGSGTVGVGDVDIPVTVERPSFKVGDPSQLAGLDLEVQWDASLADLTDVFLTPATSGWLMEFNASPGHVDISMATLDPVDVPFSPLDFLTLRFNANGTEGVTPLTVVAVNAFDLDQQAIPVVPFDGSLTTGCEKGDVIPDGEVNSADAIRTLFFAMGLLTPTPEEFCAADMNNDGVIDTGDAVLVLQKAVGAIPASPVEGTTPHLWARSGAELGEVIFNVGGAAGFEVEMVFDPVAMDFVSATAPGSGALIAVNDKDPGAVKLGFAKALNYEGDIVVRFDLRDASKPLVLKSVTAFDEQGTKQAVELGPTEIFFGVTAVETPSAGALEFLAAVPNPFNPQTELRFRMAAAGDATVSIFDAAGRAVRTLPLPGLDRGEQTVTWNGRDDSGRPVASGTYLIRITAGADVDTGRVVLLK